jgi:hypothetical protein
MRRGGSALLVLALLASAGTADAAKSPLPASFPRLTLSRAQPLVSARAGNGFFVHVWTAPTRAGGRCYFDTIDHRVTAQRPLSWPTNGGFECSATPVAAMVDRPFQHFRMSWRPLTKSRDPAKWVPPYVQGEVTTAAKPARVVIEWSGGSHALTLHGRYFAGGSPAIYAHIRRLTIVAYDSAGHVLARQHQP